ncbi:DUF6282 family protein [Nocardioides sp. LHG3406-4]|uniref:DUF6282 family protein n=1 Tax=Nocardioides sp. LHG3406-4 TaxID=2804575 RepID=UPI003CE676BB
MFDSHVHAAPDVLPRIGDDATIAGAFETSGHTGFVLKAHYESTVGRAHAVATATGLDVFGGIALNQHVGGVNPTAVAAALGTGGRVVWMPTADAHTQRAAGLPALCLHEPRLGSHSYAIPPVDPSAAAAVDLVLDLIVEHDAVLATGHLSEAECRWLAARAGDKGVTRLLFTHPSYTVPGIQPAGVRHLARIGGHIEITAYQLLHQPQCTPALLARVAEAAGAKLVLSSDGGQPDSPMPPEAVTQLIDVLAGEGLDRGWLKAAAAEVPHELFAPA